MRAIKVLRIIGDGVVFNFCDHFPLTDKNCVSTVAVSLYFTPIITMNLYLWSERRALFHLRGVGNVPFVQVMNYLNSLKTYVHQQVIN